MNKLYNKKQEDYFHHNEKMDYIFKKLNMKSIVIDYIFSSLNFNNINEKTLNYLYVNQIDNINFIIEPLIKGIKCFCVIFKNKNNYYSCLVEKKNLLYQKEIQLSEVKISNFDIKFSNIDIYNGTILDGVYIKDSNNFIIYDIYYIAGENLLNTPIKYKFIQFNQYLENFQMSNFNIFINNYNELINWEDEKRIYKPLNNKNNILEIEKNIIGLKIISNRTKLVFNIYDNNNDINNSNKLVKTYNNKNKIQTTQKNNTSFSNDNQINNQIINNNNNNNIPKEYIDKINNNIFKYNNQHLKSSINKTPELNFYYYDDKLYLSYQVAYNPETQKFTYLPYYICPYDNDKSLIHNKELLDNYSIVECKITNEGIIPFNISTLTKVDTLISLIDLLDI